MKNEASEIDLTCHVAQNGQSVLCCPKCGESKTFHSDDGDHTYEPFKIKCSCGALIRARLEYRKSYRKKVSLSGSYQLRGNGAQGEVIVESISFGGIGFSCLRKPNLQKGEQLEIVFTLDNPRKSKIKLWVEVVHINQKYVGAKRCDTIIGQSDLGFYLK
jgi:hypothetical protein